MPSKPNPETARPTSFAPTTLAGFQLLAFHNTFSTLMYPFCMQGFCSLLPAYHVDARIIDGSMDQAGLFC